MSYLAPTIADLRAIYPAFAAVADGTITLWLNKAQLEIGPSWPDSDRADAQMAWAAHRMAEVSAVPGASVGTGVTSFRSGSFSANISDAAASRTGFEASVYGRDFLRLQKRNFGGPILA